MAGDDEETPEERAARIHDLSRERPAPDRTRRSDELETMRSDRAEALEDLRIERQRQLAVADAVRRERVDVRMEKIELEVKAVKGAVERAERNYAEVTVALRSFDDRFDAMEQAQKTRDAVNAALADSVKESADKAQKSADRFDKANEQAVSGKMLLVAVAAVLVALLGVIVTVLAATHVL